MPPALETLLLRIPWYARRRAARISRQEIMLSIPVRNELIEWELHAPEDEESDEPAVVVLRVPRRGDRLGRILSRVFAGPPYRQVVLDELGTDVWQLCDGESSIETLVSLLAKKHKLERREVELSLTMYLKTLARRGFIGLRLRP